MTKKMLLTVAAVSVLSGGLVATTNAFAQTPATQNAVPSLVQEIAGKFHLNTGDVQAVFNQHRQEVQAKRESSYENYLGKLVKKGKITQGQEQLILNEHKQLETQTQNDFKNFKTMTPAQRKAQFLAIKQQAENWAKQNSIKIQYLRPFGSGMRKLIGFWREQLSPMPA